MAASECTSIKHVAVVHSYTWTHLRTQAQVGHAWRAQASQGNRALPFRALTAPDAQQDRRWQRPTPKCWLANARIRADEVLCRFGPALAGHAASGSRKCAG